MNRRHLGIALASLLLWMGTRSTAQAVPFTSGLVLQYDGSDVSTSGGLVTAWNNQGSAGAVGNAVPEASNPPSLSVAALNGQNTVDFPGGAGSALVSGLFSTAIAQPNTMFMVARDDGGNSPVIFDGVATATGRNFFRPLSSGGFHLFAGTSRTGGSGHATARFEIYSVDFNQAASRVDVFGNPGFVPGATIGTLGLGQLGLGNSPPNGSPANLALTGQIAEVLFYDRLVSSTERTAAENYLSSKYNLGDATSGSDNFLSSGDFYTGDLAANGNYDFDVFGIGNDGTSTLASAASGGLGLDGTGTLSPGEWAFAGHDGGANGIQPIDHLNNRWARNWFIDITGLDADLLTLSFDWQAAGLGAIDPTFDRLLFSSDGTTFSKIDALQTTVVGDTIQFTISGTSLTDGFFTLGQAVPEPSSFVLLGGGVTLLVRRRRKVTAAAA